MLEQEKVRGTMYAFATLGARTERGGYLTHATSGLVICGLRAACVGDIVTYRDGSEAAIIDGTGKVPHYNGKCLALVGSHLSNGDSIAFTPWDDGISGVFIPEGESPEGLFDPSYAPPPRKTFYRYALRGSTTARGGVLREPGGKWRSNGEDINVGQLGDLVHYADGMTARGISALAMIANPGYGQFAYVGSVLDNGDTITHSPERDGGANPDTYSPVTEDQVKRVQA
ncbi:putative Zn-binding protein involved in type VI secretion [Paraburkholderia sp. GAS333]|uniref:PAAR domain-containing protein n=1 Tax=Paraburkholderia sp. GAS333 TaxID=3156279 RepID=UPI003D1DE1EA